jgi:hypothetical protein
MNGEMDVCIKVNIRKTRSTDLEFIYTQMEVDLKVNGKMVSKME